MLYTLMLSYIYICIPLDDIAQHYILLERERDAGGREGGRQVHVQFSVRGLELEPQKGYDISEA